MKVSFVCAKGLETFIDPIANRLDLDNDFQVKKFYVSTPAEVIKAIHWGDVVWLEWANEIAAIATASGLIRKKKVIVRLHSYEVFGDYINEIDWSEVDLLISVADHIVDLAELVKSDLDECVNIETINNGVDINKFKLLNPDEGSRYNIGWVGDICYKKAPELALQIIAELGDEYVLNMAGRFIDLRYKHYMMSMVERMGLKNNVKFHGYIDIAESRFWALNDFCLNTSLHEGHPYSILEAMAQGAVPVIHNFIGSELFAVGFRWNVVSHAEESIRKMYSAQILNESKREIMRDALIERKWTFDDQFARIEQVIKEL